MNADILVSRHVIVLTLPRVFSCGKSNTNFGEIQNTHEILLALYPVRHSTDSCL